MSTCFDALIGVLGIEVEGLPVEHVGGRAFVLVGPAADLDHGLHVGDDQLGLLLGHHVGAGDDGRRVGDLSHIGSFPRIVDSSNAGRTSLRAQRSGWERYGAGGLWPEAPRRLTKVTP
jgi:hypothetical protein